MDTILKILITLLIISILFLMFLPIQYLIQTQLCEQNAIKKIDIPRQDYIIYCTGSGRPFPLTKNIDCSCNYETDYKQGSIIFHII